VSEIVRLEKGKRINTIKVRECEWRGKGGTLAQLEGTPGFPKKGMGCSPGKRSKKRRCGNSARKMTCVRGAKDPPLGEEETCGEEEGGCPSRDAIKKRKESESLLLVK